MSTTPLYLDPLQPIPQRVADLLARMTLAEKTAQMHAFWLVLAEDGEHQVRPGEAFIGRSDPVEVRRRLAHGLGQITRPLGTHGVDAASGLRALNKLQRTLRFETRLGIPAISHEECLMGMMTRDGTLFPSALAMSATWNPALMEQVGTQIGLECRAVGCQQGLAPVLDVSRDVRWGRTEETLGEDPYLVGVLATRYVRGLQGPQRDVLATLKHFVGHSFSEGARNHAPVNLGWRALNDTFLLPFEMAVKQADAGSVMPAYHDIDGEPVHASTHLLTEVLRTQWGFDGLVVADYVGVSLLYQHHGVARDAAEAAALAFNAGLDMELPGDDCAQHLATALERGLLTMAKADEIVSRVLTEKFRLGLFERDFTDHAFVPLRQPAARQAALDVARQAIVLLENNGILPLQPSQKPRIALIGPTAADPMALLSGYSFPAHLILQDKTEGTAHIVTPLQGLQAVFGAANVHYAQGCAILEQRRSGAPVFPGDVAPAGVERVSPVSQGTDGMDEAVACAQAADVAIVCVGDLAGLFQTGTVSEGSDTDSLSLPGVQQALLERIVATGTPTVVVMMAGRPYNLGGLESRVAAYLMAFAGGQEGGTALAEVLAGLQEPSGRMTVSVPTSAGAMPYFYNHSLKSGGTPIAFHFGSRYPFGHGLSYSQFAYRNLVLESDAVDLADGDVHVQCVVANTGSRPGVAVVQLYVRDRLASVVRPVKELKAFQRVELAAGQVARLSFSVPVDMLCFTHPNGQRCVEPGWFDVMVGPSSADTPLTTAVQVLGDAPRMLGRDWRMESSCSVHLEV
ncbi:glycoside hydrolase family 3 N-terminal domain-containing protein [Rhodoferax sp.]|uniref:glycoside hydrolase family 3 N-terminal domain-containing protein n=1 Tax=Rhodoferax sp. TaxID=50421 RepID=UPI0025F88240|nr:glycoside hydrolase family 3 N-terminal domain-containing protein [Rhodoferax sp.]